MKIALYIEDGLEQIVLTPQSTTERLILEKIHDGTRQMELYRGEFYDCRGGWKRHAEFVGFDRLLDPGGHDDSTMIVLRPKAPANPNDDRVGERPGHPSPEPKEEAR